MCNENYTIYFGEMLKVFQIFQQSTSKCFSKCFIPLNKIRNVFQLFRGCVISVSIYPTNAKSVSLFWTMCNKCFTFFDKVQKSFLFSYKIRKIFNYFDFFIFFDKMRKVFQSFPQNAKSVSLL